MKTFNLVSKERTYLEDVLAFNPIGFVRNPETGVDDVTLYVETRVSETGKVLYTGNVTLPLEAFALLTSPESNFDAINEIISAFDVTLAPIDNTTIQPSL